MRYGVRTKFRIDGRFRVATTSAVRSSLSCARLHEKKSTNIDFTKVALSVWMSLVLVGCTTTSNVNIKDPFNAEVRQKAPAFGVRDYQLNMTGDAFGGMTFTQGTDTQKYNYLQIAPLVNASELAKGYYTSAKTTYLVSALVGGTGSLVGGFVVGRTLSSQTWTTTDTYLLAGGAGAIAVSYLLSTLATRDFSSAVDEYNLRVRELQ